MRTLRSLLVLLLLLPVALTARASETTAEHAANVYAQQELDAAPVHGNIPDYTLSPADLAKAQHLSTIHTTLHFVEEAWGIISLLLLLGVGAMAWMQKRAQSVGDIKFLRTAMYPYVFLVFMGLVSLIPIGLISLLRIPPQAKAGLDVAAIVASSLFIWNFRERLHASTRIWVEGHFFVLLFIFATFLLDLSFTLYSQHLSRVYGLSVQGWGSWFGDQGKALALTWIGGGLGIMLLFFIIRKFPRHWWLVMWSICIIVLPMLVFVAPYGNLLFDKFEPLSLHHPELVGQLEQVVEKGHMNIPPERMFLVKASEKVTTLNAYVTGFGGSKRVVVWDTSLQKGTPDEVLFIFGHESGHYVLNHIVYGIFFSVLGLLVTLFLGYHFVQWAIARFGPRWGIASQTEWAALAVLLLAFSLFGLFSEPIQNSFSRMDEHAADVYGQEAIHGLVADPQTVAHDAFVVLGANSFADPNPSQWFEFWTYNHPAVGRRAAFGKAYNPWDPGMEPKYFKK